MKSCRKCNTTLNDNNWSNSRKTRKDYICKTCKSNEMSGLREYRKECEEEASGVTRCVSCRVILGSHNTYTTNKIRCVDCIATNTKQWKEAKGLSYMLWVGARSRARAKGIPFDLEIDDIKIPERCPVFGVPMERAEGTRGANDNSPTLDKIIPELGYVKGNVEVISWKANRLKSNGTLEDFESLVVWLREVSRAA